MVWTIEMDLFQWLGFGGMLCIVFAYLLLQMGKYDIHSFSYQLLNLVGAIALIISLLVHFNLGSFLIEIFWIGITLYGMAKNLKKKITKRAKKQ